MRTKTTSYVFAPKSKFDVNNEFMLLALVLLEEDKMPMMYLFPAYAWKTENNLFKNRDFEGLKSEPEWGLNIYKKNIPLLDEYRVEKQGEILYFT